VMIGIRKPRWAEKLDGMPAPKVYPEGYAESPPK
jgi:hypothetical protein